MKRAIIVKDLKRKYKNIDFYILLIIISIILSFSFSYLLKDNNEFLSSALLSICGGLFTGFVILLYQFFSNKRLNEVIDIINKLNNLNQVSIKSISIIDFCTDMNILDIGEDIDEETILSDNEGLSNALIKYQNYLKEIDIEMKSIICFCENSLYLNIGIDTYKEKFNDIVDYFDKYYIESEYCKNYFGGMYETYCVYNGGIKINIEDVYEDWILKMNILNNETQQLNSKLDKEKQNIIQYHNKSIVIV
ncbi:hypothetical protein [Clostridioides difficile]|uniref:hypothetical protein n=1 Tax=Clostridioides difficile TaxID=1496 RepID=UPI001C1CFA43|nr:hypothetical protein [Clostridioides difficile]HBY2691714.1 hypothetical protein [Clostridioides difficile]HDO9122933.1 hypothetical protein [Clostridioides difficile]HDO9648919.1 hypothetical protein [Clostridioides difficile]